VRAGPGPRDLREDRYLGVPAGCGIAAPVAAVLAVEVDSEQAAGVVGQQRIKPEVYLPAPRIGPGRWLKTALSLSGQKTCSAWFLFLANGLSSAGLHPVRPDFALTHRVA